MDISITDFYRQDTAKSRYAKMEQDREVYITRAINNAKLTIPMLFPDKSATSSTEFETPYQSIGARGVNNLASKLMKGLFPPNEPFFRLSLGEELQRQAAQDGIKEDDTKLEKALGMLERQLYNYMQSNRYRITISESVLQLIVAGNGLLFLPPKEGGIKMYRLSDYVVVRDGLGNWIELIVREKISYAAMPKEAKALVIDTNIDPNKNYELYTHVFLDGDVYRSYQEIEGKVLNGSDQQYPKDKVPWLPLRLRKMDGESYGRSYVDEYYGDLKSLNTLSKASVEMSAIAAFFFFVVNTSSTLRVDKLKDAQSGTFVKGKEGDLTTFQLQKLNDMQIIVPQIQDLQNRLSYAFLMNSAVQRNAERVTAEEIRYVANELEDTIGNVYALLALELQLPLVRCIMAQLMSQGLIPDTPLGKTGIQPKIITGVEALGRGYDLTKLETFMQVCSALPSFAQRIKDGAVMMKVATSIGLDESELVKTDEEVQAEQQQQQEMLLAQQAAGPVANNLTSPKEEQLQ